MVTIIIPSRKEPYLSKTIKDLLVKAKGEIEIIVVLDGYWEKAEDIVIDPRVNYLHFATSKGMRACINAGVLLAKGEYILKTDAHCLFAKGFDEQLVKDCEKHDVIVPRRYRLDPEKWEVIEDGRPPVDYESLDPVDLHGVRWEEKAIERKDVMIDEIVSAQGSCWFTPKKHFESVEGLDEDSYGKFFLEFQEISFKTWLSGGRVLVNKNTSYAHWHKTDGRGYSLDNDREKAVEFMQKWRDDKAWSKQELKFESLIKKFSDMPGWE